MPSPALVSSRLVLHIIHEDIVNNRCLEALLVLDTLYLSVSPFSLLSLYFPLHLCLSIAVSVFFSPSFSFPLFLYPMFFLLLYYSAPPHPGDPVLHLCPVGHYCDGVVGMDHGGGAGPWPCPVHSYRPSPGAGSKGDCLPCPPGYHCNSTGENALPQKSRP